LRFAVKACKSARKTLFIPLADEKRFSFAKVHRIWLDISGLVQGTIFRLIFRATASRSHATCLATLWKTNQQETQGVSKILTSFCNLITLAVPV